VTRRIRIEVDGIAATADLHDEESPKTAEAFWQTLPIDTEIWQDGWAGMASVFQPGGTALASAPESEAIVSSIYQGTLVVAPHGEQAFLAYGVAEYRDEMGSEYAARVARVREGWPALKQKLAGLHDAGQGRIKITRA
jgi:hypothetical protein